jgi:hypothetical protein
MRTGTIGGTLLTIVLNITHEDVFKTMVLGAVGAVTSFFVSLFLKKMLRRFRR